ncbi:hypothetical protein BCR33DRAFT_766022 [Rhizoclosmatium globosum]|uniref:Cyanocobalamin reductase (cyanide-eliminating) n=1 Tax=Rhizoclosmatium globosum TaxID=329046 RepID=A0A1Y2CBI7_9FUNG|nr:hypothetical protein BCR33DRAFT_766022 [Rhizoclosmatium globosum]|eukprot:ORY44388.1 hypothetical protein BCR33DRAFT_766022 [Rhizoclosmatium globosum]
MESVSIELALERTCSHGLDICVPFTAEFYNDHFGEHPPIPTLSSSGCTLSILVANNKNLWDHFKQHLILNPSAIDVRNPLDDYVASCIQASLINVVGLSTRTDVRFAFDKGDKFVAFQNLGQMIGEAFYNRSVFLCSHPVYGPWQAFRAVITIGVDASDVSWILRS